MAEFRTEVIDASDFGKVSATDELANAAVALVEKHSLNSTDAVILRSALGLASQFRAAGDSLVLVAADHRLAVAAGIPIPYPNFTNPAVQTIQTVAQALRPFPQYQTVSTGGAVSQDVPVPVSATVVDAPVEIPVGAATIVGRIDV